MVHDLSAQTLDTVNCILADCRLIMDSARLTTIMRRTGLDGVTYRFLLHPDFQLVIDDYVTTNLKTMSDLEQERNTETDENIFWEDLYKPNLLTVLYIKQGRTEDSAALNEEVLRRDGHSLNALVNKVILQEIRNTESNGDEAIIQIHLQEMMAVGNDEFAVRKIVATAEIARCYENQHPSLTETCVGLYNEVLDETKTILDASYSGVSRRGSNIELLLESKVNFWKFRKIRCCIRALKHMEVFWPSKVGREQELLHEQRFSSILDDLTACDVAKYAGRAWIDKADLRMLSNFKPWLEHYKNLNLKDCIDKALARCGSDEYILGKSGKLLRKIARDKCELKDAIRILKRSMKLKLTHHQLGLSYRVLFLAEDDEWTGNSNTLHPHYFYRLKGREEISRCDERSPGYKYLNKATECFRTAFRLNPCCSYSVDLARSYKSLGREANVRECVLETRRLLSSPHSTRPESADYIESHLKYL